MAFETCPTGGHWPRRTKISANASEPPCDGARVLDGSDNVTQQDAQGRPRIRVIEMPRRQTGVQTIVGETQRIERRDGNISTVGAWMPTVRWTDGSELLSAA